MCDDDSHQRHLFDEDACLDVLKRYRKVHEFVFLVELQQVHQLAIEQLVRLLLLVFVECVQEDRLAAD